MALIRSVILRANDRQIVADMGIDASSGHLGAIERGVVIANAIVGLHTQLAFIWEAWRRVKLTT